MDDTRWHRVWKCTSRVLEIVECPRASIEKSCRIQKVSTRAVSAQASTIFWRTRVVSAQTSTIFWRTIFWRQQDQASRWRQQAAARRSVVSDTARMQCTSGNTYARNHTETEHEGWVRHWRFRLVLWLTVLTVCLSTIPRCIIGGPREVAKCQQDITDSDTDVLKHVVQFGIQDLACCP